MITQEEYLETRKVDITKGFVKDDDIAEKCLICHSIRFYVFITDIGKYRKCVTCGNEVKI